MSGLPAIASVVRGFKRALLRMLGTNDLATALVDCDGRNTAQRPPRQLIGQLPRALGLGHNRSQPGRIEGRIALGDEPLSNSEKIATGLRHCLPRNELD